MNSTESNLKTSLPQNWQDELEAILNPGTLHKRDYPMKKLTTLRIGGPADFYVEPSSLEELKKIRNFGAKCLQEVLEKLAAQKLSLRKE